MAGVVRKHWQLIERHDFFSRHDVPLGDSIAITWFVLKFDDVVFVVEHPDECLFEGEIHHPRVELRGGDFLEPLFVLALQRYHLATVGGTATAFKGQVVVENSGEVHCDFLASCNLADGLHSVKEDLRVRGAGVADGFPVLALSAPEIAPADFVVVVLDPVNDDDVLACALLLVHQLFRIDVPGRVEHRHALFGIGPYGEVLSVLGLSQNGSLDHRLQKLLLGEVVVEEDVFKQTASFQRTDVVMDGHGHWLEVNQEKFGLMDSNREQELSAQHKHSEEGFNALPHPLGKVLFLAELVPLLSNRVVLELLGDILWSVLREAELNRFQCPDVAACVIAEAGELPAGDVLFESSSTALIEHGLGHDFKGIGIPDEVILLSSDIIADLPIRLHHKRQFQPLILQFLQLEDVP